MVTCNAFRHFKVLVTSLFVALLMTLILGISSNISCKNFRCGEFEVIGLQNSLGQFSMELLRQSNVWSSFETNSTVSGMPLEAIC